jgi:hypothetical protein
VGEQRYRLVVAGELSDHLDHAFRGMKLVRLDGETAMVGTVRDQAELHGHLRRVYDLGLTLLSVDSLSPPRRHLGDGRPSTGAFT